MTLVPVPTKTARCHSDIKGRRPFDVPASIFVLIFCNGMWLTQEPPRRFQTTCFQISGFARFSQSELLPTISDGTVASS